MELIPYGIFCLLGLVVAVANERHELRKRVERETLEIVSQALYDRPTHTINCLAPGLLK